MQPVRIFVGAQQTEVLPLRVLEYSIKRHTQLPVQIQTVDNAMAPTPTDTRFLPYTHFSYGRFAIPKLAGYRGKAIYMDSDMLVFADIAEAWNTAFGAAKILIEKITPASKDVVRRTAFMLLDCERLHWEPETIISQLGIRYDYNQLMTLAPLLDAGDLADHLPLGWNSLDKRGPESRLIHYTKIKTQPWVYAGHEAGHYWIDEVRLMLENHAIDADFIRAQVEAGHVRPSLLPELGLASITHNAKITVQTLQEYDRAAGYVIHKDLFEAMHQRKLARLAREKELDPQGFRQRRRRRRMRGFLRHPIRFLCDPRARL